MNLFFYHAFDKKINLINALCRNLLVNFCLCIEVTDGYELFVGSKDVLRVLSANEYFSGGNFSKDSKLFLLKNTDLIASYLEIYSYICTSK
ncbi:MAG TPA: hypothetical protein DEO71_17535 [Chryseobacterium sp.]|nr:hypothetical protein [Chryseobacterium sp.]